MIDSNIKVNIGTVLTPKKSALIKDNLLALYNDCASQSNTLNARNDINWDCYNKDNWDNMVDCIIEIASNLNINLDIEY